MLQEETAQDEPAGEAQKTRIALWDRLLAREGALAYLPILIVVILMLIGAYWQFSLKNNDVFRYKCYALAFWFGKAAQSLPYAQCSFLPASTFSLPAFHALPLEYPPLALAIFSLALLAPLFYYPMVFAVLMMLTSVLIYWLLLRYAPRGAAQVFALYMLIGALATAEARFDLVPAALTLLCVIAAIRKRWTYAYIALSIGFLLKIYPLLFFPALFIAEQQDARLFSTPHSPLTLATLLAELGQTLRSIRRWRWKNTLIFFGIILGVTSLFALLDFRGAVLSQLTYFANRPVQVESTGSTLLFLATHFGIPGHTVYTFGSINIVSELGGPVALVSDALLALGYLFAIYLQWRGKLNITQAFIAILLVFIVTGKVFSPQYLIWLIPLLAFSGAYDRFWLISWSLVSLLTTFIFPFLYSRTLNGLLVPYLPGFVEGVAARNALLVFLTLAYLFNWFHARERQAISKA